MIDDTHIRAIGHLIKRRRARLNISAKELARQVGVSDAHIIYIENGHRKPSFEKVMNILAALGLSYEEAFREIGLLPMNVEPARLGGRLYRIPIVTWVRAGRWQEVADAFEPGDADEWIESDVTGKNVFALRIVGDSMEPEFKEGEVIVINPHVEAQPNDFVVIKNDIGEATFKQLKRYGQSWVLHPLNPNYPDQEVKRGEFRIIGKVVKKEKRY